MKLLNAIAAAAVMNSAPSPCDQRLKAKSDHQADNHADERFPEITADDFAETASGSVGEHVFEFLFFDAQGDFTTTQQT